MSYTQPPAEPPELRIAIADGDALVRRGIADILSTAPDISIVAEAADGREADGLADRHRLDAMLLDIQMPQMDGISALRRIVDRHPELPVAMLTTFTDERFIADAVRSGARGFLLKSDDPHSLIHGVRALASGGGAFSPRVTRWLADRERQSNRGIEDREILRVLSERQIELLRHIAQGASNAQAARAMHLSEGTVKQYLSAIFSTLGIDNRVHAAIIAYRAGLLS